MSARCELCFHLCELAEGQAGFCRARVCRDEARIRLTYAYTGNC